MHILKFESGESSSTGDLRPRQTQSIRVSRLVVAGLLAAVLVMAPTASLAGDSAADVSKESGLGAAAAVSSLFYGPTKLLYATGGLIVGGLAWAFTAGDTEVAKKVFTRSLRGDYVITPAMLVGDESLEFIGRDSSVTEAPIASVASAAPAYEESEYDELGW